MQNKGTDYIRRILRDKARLKRWRQIMLCLSCIVVFCTAYVLILPAITLEKKATCEEEEQIAIQEEQNLVQEEDESTVQGAIQSEDSDEVEFVSCEPIEEETDGIEDVEITEDPEEEMDVDFASGEEDAIAAAADEAVMPEAGAAGGFDLSAEGNSNRLKNVTLLYKLPGNENWQEFSTTDNNTVIPANAKIKLQVEYQEIQIENLMTTYNCKLTYNLPELMRNITTEGGIFDGNNKVGTVTCENGKIIVIFEENYLNGLKNNGRTTISGDFYAEADVNLNKVPKTDGKTTVIAGNKSYHLNFEPDAVAKYGQISVDKTCGSSQVISTANGDYLAYTITVTAGEDGCPDVSVVDTIVNNKTSVDSYVGIGASGSTLSGNPDNQNPYETIAEGKTHGTVYLGNTTDDGIPSENASVTAPGSMVWKIGDMAARESRTLTYYVKLADNVGLDGKEIKNKADVYSKTYKRAYNEASFIPKIDYTMPKSHNGNIVRNTDGTYTITYKIEFNLDRNKSNYALKNLEFRDYLDDQSDNIHTDSNALPYINYNRDSVRLYKNGAELSSTDYTVSWAKGNDNYITPWNDSNNNPTRFKITGASDKPITVNPGDSYYATYTVTVKPEALAAMQANNVDVKNRYYVHVSNANSNFGNALNRVWDSANVGNYKWDEKTVGTGTAADQTIEMGTGVKYDLTSGTVQADTSTDSSFTIPAGSYPYTVEVNQTLGEWNATDVSMTDALSSDKMKYTGYAKVEAREYNAKTNTYDVKETKWVKIDGLNSFTLKPLDLGWTGVNYAYKFTYYAKPVNADFSSAKVTNIFSLSGNVVKDDVPFDISDIYSQKEITISGSYKMNVKKESWYYEEPKTDAATWQNGKLYWVIEVSGTAIMKDTTFRDAISKDSGLTDSYLHSDSLAGIYMGTLPDDKTIIGYNSLEELLANGGLDDIKNKFTELKFENSKNFDGTDNYSELSIKANEKIELGNAKLYFIVRTEPQSLPTNYRDAFTFRNNISTSDDGNIWIDHGSADKLLCGGADILKELGQTFTYDGETVTSNTDGRDGNSPDKIAANGLSETGAGQYAAWAFKVNYAGELSGTYRVLETIPNGMELAYIRIKWTGSEQGTISSKEISGSEVANWTKKTITAATDNNGRIETTTYYVNGNQALIELGDFKAGKERDSYSVDVQVVCRVTDPDVLLGGATKTFINQVTLQTANGQDINTATSPATIKPQKKLDKQIADKRSEKITFTIEANPLGEKLPAENGTTLTLVDKLSPLLILDTGSIRVVNSKTNEEVTYKASFDATANTLKIAIPRNIPVTITYTATVNAPPGQAVSFSNEACWENYSSAGGDSVEEENYSYAAGGTVGAGNNIKLKIIKKDENNLSSSLQGAVFKMVPCNVENGQIKVDTVTAKEWTGTTDPKGEILFGEGSASNQVMDYNTVYKVTETTAPSGYVTDSKPIYIMVPRIETGQSDYSEYVKNCMQMKNPKINIQYQSTYELTVLNHKGEITVEKKFKNAGGRESSPVSGMYKFGLYENPEGTTTPLQTITITYLAGAITPKTEKFVNLDLSKTYYVYELDDDGNPIKDSNTVATVNKMEYLTSYATTNTDSTTGVNSAVSGNTVTVTNQSRVKELPSTGSYGPLIFRLAGAVLIFFAGLQMLINIKRRACNNR